jgi:hypothetical protein
MSDDIDKTERVQYVVKDTASALKMKREERKEAEKRYKAIVAKAKAEQALELANTKARQKLELAKMRLQMSAKEAASKHIAVFGPLYLLILCGGFLGAIQYIPSTEISVVSSILTLLITMIGANLRSIVAGENGDSKKPKDEEEEKEKKPKSK